MKKVYICEFYQESNAFNPVLSGYDLYQWGGTLCGKKNVSRSIWEMKVLRSPV